VVDKENHPGVNRNPIKIMERNQIEVNSHKNQQQI